MVMKIAMLILLAVLVMPLAAQAEEKPEEEKSEYSRDALRVKWGFWESGIVSGLDGEVLDDIDFLTGRGDEIGSKFRSYQSRQTTSNLIGWLAVGAFLGATLTYDRYSDDNVTSAALILGGGGLLIGGVAVGVKAQESLSQGIWMYNETIRNDGIPREPAQEEKHGETPQEIDLR
jgi:hypothetical protein